MKIETEVKLSGGVFDSPSSIVERGVHTSMEEVGSHGVKVVRRRLSGVLVNPTGHYKSRIDYTVVNPTMVEVHDSGVVYGPWLEGLSSRNARTRFKGYSTFRKSLNEIERDIDTIIKPQVGQMAKRLE